MSDSDAGIKGRCPATVSAEGVILSPAGKDKVVLPIGTNVKYQGGNRLSVDLGSRKLELAVERSFSAQNLFTHDLSAFLNGDIQTIQSNDYVFPWYLMVLSVLPFGALYILHLMHGFEDVVVTSVVAAFIVVLAAMCLLVATKERWSILNRFIAIMVISLACYGTVGGVCYLINQQRPTKEGTQPIQTIESEEERLWKFRLREDARFRYEIPGEPVESTEEWTLPSGEKVKMTRLEVNSSRYGIIYTAHFAEVSPEVYKALTASTEAVTPLATAGLPGAVIEQVRDKLHYPANEKTGAIEFVLRSAAGKPIVRRFYAIGTNDVGVQGERVTKNHIYFFTCSGDKVDDKRWMTGRFINSFTHTEIPLPKVADPAAGGGGGGRPRGKGGPGGGRRGLGGGAVVSPPKADGTAPTKPDEKAPTPEKPKSGDEAAPTKPDEKAPTPEKPKSGDEPTGTPPPEAK
jgi:hypothetical protein